MCVCAVTGTTDCGLLEGRIVRTAGGGPGSSASGFFPVHCVAETSTPLSTMVGSGSATVHRSTSRVQGRREATSAQNKHFATAPRLKKQ